MVVSLEIGFRLRQKYLELILCGGEWSDTG